MSRIAQHILACCFVILTFASTADAQPAKPAGSTICCNNFVVYARHLHDQLSGICKQPDIVATTVEAYVAKIKGAGNPVKVNPCPGANPTVDLKHAGKTADASGCYPIKVLLPDYVASFTEGQTKCGSTVIAIPDPPTCPPNECCSDVILLQNIINNPPGDGERFLKPDGTGTAPDVMQTAPPQIPVEPVVGISVHQSHRPGDTRAASVQLPVVMTDEGAFGSVSVNLSPVRLLMAEDGYSNEEVKLARYMGVLSGLKVSFAAARTPEPEAHASAISTRSAAAITFDFKNDRDPLSNSVDEFAKDGKLKHKSLKTCLDEKAVELAPKIVSSKRTEGWKLAKDEFKSCIASTALAYGLGLGLSSDAARVWWANDFSWGIHGLTLHSGQWFADKSGFNPLEAGLRYSLSTTYFTASIDGAAHVLLVDNIDSDARDWNPRGRFLAGGSLTISLFSGLTATAGARVVPPAWDAEERGYDMDGVFSIGWGGADLQTEYFRGRLGRAIEWYKPKEPPKK